MQFHLNGFRAGDPEVADSIDNTNPSPAGSLPDEVDILIVGCGMRASKSSYS
jgi:phenol 2-monooxygenase